MTVGGPWTGHGHIIPGVTVAGDGRPPVARCGGPSLCSRCALDSQRHFDKTILATDDRLRVSDVQTPEPCPGTKWMQIDMRWRDVNPPHNVRQADGQWVEVVEIAPGQILVQDDNGCHRVIPFENIEGLRTHIEFVEAEE